MKNFHNLRFGRDFEDWAGQVEGNWMGRKLEVNSVCQMVKPDPYSADFVKNEDLASSMFIEDERLWAREPEII